MSKKFIFSAGTGRCGTTSIKALLNIQHGTNITKEAFPLSFDYEEEEFLEYVDHIKSMKGEIVGDSAFYLTPHISNLIKHFHPIKILYPFRECREQVDSNMKHWKNRNHVTHEYYAEQQGINLGKINKFFKCHPKFHTDKEEGLWRRCHLLHSLAVDYECFYPDFFRIVHYKELLNDEEKQEDILRWLGFNDPVINTNIMRNVGK